MPRLGRSFILHISSGADAADALLLSLDSEDLEIEIFTSSREVRRQLERLMQFAK